MATPGTQVQQKQQIINQWTPNQLTWLVKDFAGDALDISSGYTANCRVTPTLGQDYIAPVSVAGTFTYGADGTLTLTQNLANSVDMAAGTYDYTVRVSNDAFTSWSLAARGKLNIIGSPA